MPRSARRRKKPTPERAQVWDESGPGHKPGPFRYRGCRGGGGRAARMLLMPVFPDLGLIFVHVPKTGGGTIRHALSPYRQAQSSSIARRATSFLPVMEPLDKLHIRMHDSAAWMRRKIGPALYDRFLSFAIVRDPYDRAISEYEFLRQRPSHRRHSRAMQWTFTDFVRQKPARSCVQVGMIADPSDRLLVDRLVRFEAMAEGVNAILEQIGVPERIGSGRRNMSVRRPRESYLTDEAVEVINRRSARDFVVLGYPRIGT